MKKHIQLYIYGKVQGVWYRGSTQQKAMDLGLCGIVRNQADGSVYAEVEGEEKVLEELITWCKQGPPMAKVDRVELKSGELKHYPDFKILRK